MTRCLCLIRSFWPYSPSLAHWQTCSPLSVWNDQRLSVRSLHIFATFKPHLKLTFTPCLVTLNHSPATWQPQFWTLFFIAVCILNVFNSASLQSSPVLSESRLWRKCSYSSILYTFSCSFLASIPPLSDWVVGCWHGYLSIARCRLAYVPVDATATHCLLLQ